jgi:hypothetical protein
MKLKELVIKKSKWLRGKIKRGTGSALVSTFNDNKMCCLGFLGRKCKVPEEAMHDIELPSGVDEEYKGLFPQELFTSRWLEDPIADVNDDATLTDSTRISKLRPLFRKLGYKLKFVP